MTVIKRFIDGNWQTVVVGRQGETGPTGPTGPSGGGSGSPLGPLGFENITGIWDSGEGASMVLIDDPTILNEKMVLVAAASTHETDPVIVQIDYGLGDLGDRFEVVSGSGSSLTIGYYISIPPDPADPAEATNIFGPTGYLPTVPPLCVVSLTKAMHAEEMIISEETVMVDAWVMSAGQMELDV